VRAQARLAGERARHVGDAQRGVRNASGSTTAAAAAAAHRRRAVGGRQRGGTATANLMVTGGLAIICFFVIQWHAFRELGLGGWLEHLCGGSDLVRGPKGLYLVIPIIFAVEFLGLFIKPAALAIRLFANMVGGHTLMATLLMFGMMAAKAGLGGLAVGGITLASGAFALVIFFLEIFVAFLQAFIFMFLTAVFISTMSHHDEEHGDEHAHAEAHH